MQLLTNSQENWHEQRRMLIEDARKHPEMWIGEPLTAHNRAVAEPLQLALQAKAFRNPVSARVLLSPTQYIVCCYTGPLVRTIQKLFSWENKRMLDEGWHETQEKISRESFNRFFDGLPRQRGWRGKLSRPDGPRLYSPMRPLILARRFVIGYRVDKGMWWQSFENGWPQSETQLLTGLPSVGLFVAAELDTHWFTGLPFAMKTVEVLAKMPHVTVEWHENDDLLPNGSLSVESLGHWIHE